MIALAAVSRGGRHGVQSTAVSERNAEFRRAERQLNCAERRCTVPQKRVNGAILDSVASRASRPGADLRKLVGSESPVLQSADIA